ncbi:hypothetical protein PO816_002876 [Cronobacter dublinensis]|nr:hypothetical protein [Cronobacter dublinensis]
MNLNIISKKIHTVSLEEIQSDSNKKPIKADVSLTNEIYANTKQSNIFRIRYKVSITIESKAKVELAYDFDFKSDEEFTNETANSLGVRAVAPSLAYPYIKAYAEQLISMSGLGNYNLPYFDFITDPFDKPE